MPCGSGILGEGDASGCLYLFQPLRTVRTHAREDDAYGPAPVMIRQGAEEDVDGKVRSVLGVPGGETQGSLGQSDGGPGRDDVYMIGQYLPTVHGIAHGHAGHAGEEFAQETFVAGIEMLHQDEAHARRFGNVREQSAERFQPPRRCPDAYYGEDGRFGWFFSFACRGSGGFVLTESVGHRLINH